MSIISDSRRWLVAIAVLLIATFSLSAPAAATGAYSMPAQVSSDTWVIDDANQITRLNEGKLAKQLSQLAASTGQEVRYVTIHRLDYGETAQSFADQLFERWFSPSEGANQTVIVLDDVTNTAGIHTGSATGELLTADIAESVVQETIKAPLVKSNNYNKAFEAATERLTAVLSGEADPGPPELTEEIQVEGTFATAEETEANRDSSTLVVIVLLVLATVIPMATYYWYQSIGG